METLSSIWEVVSDLAVVNCMSAGAAFAVNWMFPTKPAKDDDDRNGPSDESFNPEPTGGDGIDLELRKIYEEFEKEPEEVGIS